MSSRSTLLMLVRFSCILSLLVGAIPVLAQQSDNAARIDSLLAAIEEYKTLDQHKVDMLNQLGYEYWIVAPAKSETYAQQALEIAKILPYDKGLAYANRVIGVAHWVRGNPELAFRYLLDGRKNLP